MKTVKLKEFVLVILFKRTNSIEMSCDLIVGSEIISK